MHMSKPFLIFGRRSIFSNKPEELERILPEVTLLFFQLSAIEMEIDLVREVRKHFFCGSHRHAFHHQRNVRSGELRGWDLIDIFEQKRAVIEVEELVNKRNKCLFARVARQDFCGKTQRVRLAFIVLNGPDGTIKSIHSQAYIEVTLLLVLAEASFEIDECFDQRACGEVRYIPVELANRINLARDTNKEFIENLSTDCRICCSIDGAIKIIPMLVLDHPTKQTPLGP